MWLLLACTRGDDGPRPHVPEPTPTADTGTSTGPLVFDGPRPTNLIVLSVDTARRDHFSRWDPRRRDLTPFLDARMREGVVLDDLTHCTNWTVGSSACLFWGASLIDRAPDLGMVPILGNDNRLLQTVPDGPGLAHSMTDAGFETMMVTANPWFGTLHGSVQGFSRYAAPGNRPAAEIWTTAASAMVSDPLDPPFYLHLHFFEPHDPYLPAEEFVADDLPDPGVPVDSDFAQARARALYPTMDPADQQALVDNFRGRYEAEFRWFDAQVSAIWADLDQRGMLDDTLVVFVTDHGEALFEKGYFGHAYFLPPAENDGAAFFWAKNLAPGSVVEPRRSIDLAPTVLDLFDVGVPPSMTGDVLRRTSGRPVRTAFTDAFAGPVNSVREGNLLLQFFWATDGDVVHLCDVAADPDCLVNRYDPAAPSDDARRLWALLEPEIRAVAPFVTGDVRVPDGPPYPPELTNP